MRRELACKADVSRRIISGDQMASGIERPFELPSETILEDILESITDAVVTIDEDHKILMCNKAAEEMFGYRRRKMIGEDVTPLIPQPHQPIHRGYVERYIRTGIPRVIGKSRECMAQRRDGTSFPVEISYSASKTEDRLYFTAVIRDITKRKDMEREIRFMERLADMGKAAAQITHEIRKPLMLIGGFARQVCNAATLENDEKARQKLNIVVDEVRRLEALLNGFSLLTRPPVASEKHCLSLNQVLQETLDLMDPMLKDQEVALEAALESEPLLIHGDPDQLKQVFLNLLQNAVEAVSGKGIIRVASKKLMAAAIVTIQDDGPGISRQLRDKVFDPFFTTKPEGSGLGLAISRNIIQDHGGSLTLDSALPGGAVFTISVPITTA
jgi:PAS domain S-box-containing protein